MFADIPFDGINEVYSLGGDIEPGLAANPLGVSCIQQCMKHSPPFDGFFDIWALHRFAEQCAFFLVGETLEFPWESSFRRELSVLNIKLRCGKFAFGDIIQQRSADSAFEAGRLLGSHECHIRQEIVG